jgi:hypothetical protein
MDEAIYRATYNSDPDDETIATFYGMIARIPDAIKSAWRGDGTFESRSIQAEDRAIARMRLENISEDK